MVIASYGRQCTIEAGDRTERLCYPRGKKLDVVVGDRVLWQPTHDEGVIESTLPRRNQLFRQDEKRSKSFAANLDQVLILLAAEPVFSERLLARALIACEAARIPALIALNKADLKQAFAENWDRLTPYRTMGYDVRGLAVDPPEESAPFRAAFEALRAALQNRATLVLGPSGVGKSTLVNRLVPAANATTGAISAGLKKGTHTTTRTHWYWLDAAESSAIIDSPGFQEFGLNHIAAADLAQYLPDFRPHLGHCRFYNCTHTHEPGCAVVAAVGEGAAGGAISTSRYRIYTELRDEISGASA